MFAGAVEIDAALRVLRAHRRGGNDRELRGHAAGREIESVRPLGATVNATRPTAFADRSGVRARPAARAQTWQVVPPPAATQPPAFGPTVTSWLIVVGTVHVDREHLRTRRRRRGRRRRASLRGRRSERFRVRWRADRRRRAASGGMPVGRRSRAWLPRGHVNLDDGVPIAPAPPPRSARAASAASRPPPPAQPAAERRGERGGRRPRARRCGRSMVYRSMRSTLLRISCGESLADDDLLHDAAAIDEDVHRQAVDAVLVAQRAAVDDDRIHQLVTLRNSAALRAFSSTSTPTTAARAAPYFARRASIDGRLFVARRTPGREEVQVDRLPAQTRQAKALGPANVGFRPRGRRLARRGPSGCADADVPLPCAHAPARTRGERRTRDGKAAEALTHSSDSRSAARSRCICATSSPTSAEKPLLAHVAEVAQREFAPVDRVAGNRAAKPRRSAAFRRTAGWSRSRPAPRSRGRRSGPTAA